MLSVRNAELDKLKNTFNKQFYYGYYIFRNMTEEILE